MVGIMYGLKTPTTVLLQTGLQVSNQLVDRTTAAAKVANESVQANLGFLQITTH